MNIVNLTYSEIQNLRILAEIKAYETGADVAIYDIPNVEIEPASVYKPKPLPIYVADTRQKSTRRSNVNMRIRLRNHNARTNDNFLLVSESTLVNPDKNIISIDSAIGKILNHSSIGDNFLYADNEYTVIDIAPTPKARM
jgi:hypothetical protein